jgi:hypothetical protein
MFGKNLGSEVKELGVKRPSNGICGKMALFSVVGQIKYVSGQRNLVQIP